MREKIYGRIYIYSDCRANFSNVLSVSISRYTDNLRYDEKSKYLRTNTGLNFDLNTGEELAFEDLFTNDANIKNIISQSAYTSISKEYLGDEEASLDELDADMNKVKFPNIEERVIEIINYYNSGKEFDFCFSPRYGYMYIDDIEIEIRLADFYDQIAIFKRFVNNEKLFEKENKRETMVFFDRQSQEDYIIY